MTEQQIKTKLLKAAAKAHKNLAKIYKGFVALESGNLQAAEDSIPPDEDPNEPPGSGDD